MIASHEQDFVVLGDRRKGREYLPMILAQPMCAVSIKKVAIYDKGVEPAILEDIEYLVGAADYRTQVEVAHHQGVAVWHGGIIHKNRL